MPTDCRLWAPSWYQLTRGMVPSPHGPQAPQLPDFCGSMNNSLKGFRESGSPECTPGAETGGCHTEICLNPTSKTTQICVTSG